MASFSLCSFPLILLLLQTALLPILPTTSYPINNICKQTKSPSYCYKVLGPANPGASLQDLDQTLIDTSISQVAGTSAKIQSLLSQTTDPNLSIVYNLCSNYYGAAQTALDAATEKLRSGQYRDVVAAANTVSGDAAACKNTFSIAPSQTIAIASDNNDLDLLSNVFLVASRILSG